MKTKPKTHAKPKTVAPQRIDPAAQHIEGTDPA